MKVAVDPTRCQGHGLCAALSPHLFELDDDGHSRLADTHATEGSLDSAHIDDALDAAASCPEEAISVAAETDADRQALR